MSSTRKAGTRTQIFDAAVALIAERGFSATSVDDIAAKAGVAKGSVYYNFGSKAEMFDQLIREGIDSLSSELHAATQGKTGWDSIEALVTRLLEGIRDQTAFAKIMTAEVFRTGRDWQESLGLVRDQAMGVFMEAITSIPEAQRPGVRPELAGATLFGATLVAGLEWLTFEPELPIEEVRDTLLALLRGRLAPRG